MADQLIVTRLREGWRQICAVARWKGNTAALGDELLDRYAEWHRAYHNLNHLDECLEELATVSDAHDPIALTAALWFHDAVYDPTRTDNETASADLAAARLTDLGERPSRIARIRELILDTAHRSEPATNDGRIITDIDLAIFGKTPARFDNYDSGIRLEYAHVPDDVYRPARAAILRRFLARQTIYRTPLFVMRYEVRARDNLNRAIARLERGPNDSPA